MNVKLHNVIISKKNDSVRIVGKSNKWNHWKSHQYMKLKAETGLHKRDIRNPNDEFYIKLK